jgi:hypothetical protein
MRLDLMSPARLTPFVGRESELALLQERWGQVQEGQGRVVVLSGDAGIGKSRLIRQVAERARGRDRHGAGESWAAVYGAYGVCAGAGTGAAGGR